MQRDFEGGVYWDELAKVCGDILKATGFQGNTVHAEKLNVGRGSVDRMQCYTCVIV